MKTKLIYLLMFAIAAACVEQNTDSIRKPLIAPMGMFDLSKLTAIGETGTPLSHDLIDTWAQHDSVKSYKSVWRDANLAFELVDTDDKLQTFMKEYGDVAVL